MAHRLYFFNAGTGDRSRRKVTGFTDPVSAEKGTVRGDFGEDSIVKANAEFRPVQNLVHASDAEGAKHELQLWFPELK